MIRVESRRKDRIRILYVIMVKCKARNRCGRGCLVRVRVVCKVMCAHLVRWCGCHRLKGVWDR
uniref:Uncharacterized protein n=1 Tax=Helianthus annuus TaxID=4232 RepID=A0A251RL85_HELAN